MFIRAVFLVSMLRMSFLLNFSPHLWQKSRGPIVDFNYVSLLVEPANQRKVDSLFTNNHSKCVILSRLYLKIGVA